MLVPVTQNMQKKSKKLNQFSPNAQMYAGTAVRVSTNVPIRKELVTQLMRSVGMRLKYHC